MGDDIVAVVALFFAGPTAWSRLFLLGGLFLALVNCFRFLVGRPSVVLAAKGAPLVVRQGRTAFLRGPKAAIHVPLAMILLGACVGAIRQTPWFLGCAVVLAAVIVDVVRRLLAEHGRRGEDAVAGPVLAVVLATSALVLVGAITTVRLVVAPDPREGFKPAFTAKSVVEAGFSIVIPLVVFAALAALLSWRRPPWRRWAEGRRISPTKLYLAGVAGVFALAALPILDPLSTNELTFLLVATPEYAKVLYTWVLAVVLARYAIGFQVRPPKLVTPPGDGPWIRRAPVGALRRLIGVFRWLAGNRHVGYTFLLFVVLALVGAVRSDNGPTIPVLVATVVVVVFLLRAQVRSGVRLWDTLVASRSLSLALVLVGAFAYLVLQLDYVKARQDAHRQPWTFNWSVGCTPPPDGVRLPSDTPDDWRPCLLSLDAAVAAKRSQVAQSMAAVADGGVWGRGLADTTVGQLPAGSTDFVLAVIWNKLGGAAVVLLTLLLALLAAALARCRTHLTRFAEARAGIRGAERRARAARLFAVGVAAMLWGQYAFVLLATLNVVPHSGITVPFLSRGGHSLLALTAAVAMAVWLLYRADAPPTPVPPTATRSRVDHTPVPVGVRGGSVRRVAPLLFLVTLLGAALCASTITIAPYGRYAEDRPLCPSDQARVDPALCSSDRVANRRTSVELRVGGEVQYSRDRSRQEWVAKGTPSVTLSDLAGLIRLDGHAGTLNPSLDDLVDNASGTSLRERVLPTPGGPEPGRIDLTVDPAIQRRVTAALRSDALDAGPLAGGVVVMDARSGHVLAASSAPTALEWPDTPPPVSGESAAAEQAAVDFGAGHGNFGAIKGGELDESGEDCETLEWDRRCQKWTLQAAPADPDPAELAERKRYAPGTPDAALPTLEQDRALGSRYGLGSTFKVVVAAAFLKLPGRTAMSTIPSPAVIRPRYGRPIENYDRGAVCAGTVDGVITLKQALTVSCNTAFVALAQQIGWPAIRETASGMGFTTQGGGVPDRAWLAGPTAGVASRVPPDVDSAEHDSLGNNTLGGGRVEGTPLQMATVMTVVANGGVVVQPTIVSGTAGPFGRDARTYRGGTREVLTGAQARELAEALGGVTRDDDGTAHRLTADPARELRVKTGTHEIYGETDTPPNGEFAKQVAWVVGALGTAAGPVTFAVAVETKHEKDGSRRAQWLAQQVVDEVVEARG